METGGPRSREVGEAGAIAYLTLHCHHQNDIAVFSFMALSFIMYCPASNEFSLALGADYTGLFEQSKTG